MLGPGTVVGGRYRLEERLASGGVGEVWRCSDEPLGRIVAVKILLPYLPARPGFTERFQVEAWAVASVNHPGVVSVHDCGTDESVGPYVVMEYIEGDSLRRTLARVGRLTTERTMALVAQAADALNAGHEKGVVHGEVKAGNLLIRPNDTLVLTSFGIARSAGDNVSPAGSVVGHTTYLSPEQAMGDQATYLWDIFALGLVAYQCLSGQQAFEGDHPAETAMRLVRYTAPPLPQDVPSNVDAIVERAMAKEPTARWPSAAALAKAAREAGDNLGVTPRGAIHPHLSE